MKTPQWAHQKKEYDEHRLDPARAWLWQMRTGKSKQAIDNACYLYEAQEIGGVLIVAPNGVHRNWISREIPRHHWDTSAYGSFAWQNSDPDNAAKFDSFMNPPWPALRWLAVNQESLIIERCKRAIAKFIRSGRSTMLIVDESHHFAVPGAKRTAVARGLGRACSYRRILSGTPVENSPLQAFSQFEILEKGALGFTTFGGFKNEFAIFENVRTRGGRSYPKITAFKNGERLKQAMSRFTSVVLRSDVEDLPEVQIDTRVVEWDPHLRKAWRDCKAKASAFFLERGAREIVDGGAALVKLQQIEGGFWKQDEKIEALVDFESSPKVEALRDEIVQHDGQVVVWAIFRHELEALSRLLGKRVCLLYGGSRDRQKLLDDFRSGQYDVALCQPAAVGEGQDLSTATKIIWFSQTPDAIVRQQANERATAVGKGSVQIVDLITPGGTDWYFKKITEKKVTMADDMSRRGMLNVLKDLDDTFYPEFMQ
jgi:SNF2 family DNA or RNA helicase